MTETLENHPGEKQVWLSIVSEVTARGDTDRTEFVTEGAFYRESDAECLSYRETEVSGMSGTTTTVRLEPDKVSVIRLGSVNALMEFEKGKRCVAMYTTPFGDVPLSIQTRAITVDRNEANEPVQIHLDYVIGMEGKTNSVNTMTIEVRDRK